MPDICNCDHRNASLARAPHPFLGGDPHRGYAEAAIAIDNRRSSCAEPEFRVASRVE